VFPGSSPREKRCPIKKGEERKKKEKGMNFFLMKRKLKFETPPCQDA
jgi:hypothetical protein